MRETSTRVSLWREHEFGGAMMATGGDCGEGKGRADAVAKVTGNAQRRKGFGSVRDQIMRLSALRLN